MKGKIVFVYWPQCIGEGNGCRKRGRLRDRERPMIRVIERGIFSEMKIRKGRSY